MKKISEILKEERITKKLSLEDVEKTLKIRKQFLIAIEEGRLHALPSESYAQGFVKNYADFLGIPPSQSVPLFRREYKEEELDVVPHFTKSQPTKKINFFSHKSIFIGIACLIVIVYVVFQFHSLFFGPQLSVKSPKPQQVVSNNIVEISGTTDPYATIFVNGAQVYVALDGSFEKSLYLFSGKQAVKIVAQDRNGKKTEKDILVSVK